MTQPIEGSFKDGRPLLVISIEGLATAAIGCYGSSWNQTPAMDQIAASGCVFDRWISTQDRQPGLPDCLAKVDQWLEPWKGFGSTILISDIDVAEMNAAEIDAEDAGNVENVAGNERLPHRETSGFDTVFSCVQQNRSPITPPMRLTKPASPLKWQPRSNKTH